jgi:hypothetical protein
MAEVVDDPIVRPHHEIFLLAAVEGDKRTGEILVVVVVVVVLQLEEVVAETSELSNVL